MLAMMETATQRTPTKRVNFTVDTLKRFIVPSGKAEAWMFDAKCLGLGYRLTANGVGAFYVFRRVKGRPAKIRLGGTEITIEQARKLAAIANAQIAQGIDPREQRRQERRDSATLWELLDHFIETHSKPHKKSWEDDEAMVDRYLAEWKCRRLADIKQEDIRALHKRVGDEHGKYAANRLLSLLHAAYEKAGNLYSGPNPVHGIAKFKEKSRDRFLTADELPRFFKSLLTEKNGTIRDYILILLLVGARRTNTAAMRWNELDLVPGLWRIPETKNGQPLIVPLSEPALRILIHRKKSAAGEWVFPTASHTKKSASGHIVEFKDTWKAILKRAGISDLRLHDLRRSLGSWLAMNGASLPLIGRALGHTSQQATAIYARLSVGPVRLAVAGATDAIMERAPAKLLPSIRRKRK